MKMTNMAQSWVLSKANNVRILMFKVVAAAVINIFIITFFCLLEVGLV
jgi:hypothetical protein